MGWLREGDMESGQDILKLGDPRIYSCAAGNYLVKKEGSLI